MHLFVGQMLADQNGEWCELQSLAFESGAAAANQLLATVSYRGAENSSSECSSFCSSFPSSTIFIFS